MPVINILPPHVADMIAAGEVVERPASVVKELMENAFDAGAKNITVEIRGGGATYIRVTDDGCGMAPEDAGVAFLRHATSKLRDERGLEAIGTMGFRGEALAAISAVSHIELMTRQKGASAGTVVTLDAGDIQDMGPAGCPEGTTMTVRDLFFNTPARLKFLKSDRSEASACVQTALRCALGRPEVSVRLLRDGKEEFFSPGDGQQNSCIYTLLGRELANSLLHCHSEDEGLKLAGYVSSPAAGRGNRTSQYFFCNGRTIKSTLLQTAVEQAYKNSLLTGRFPGCVLYLDIAQSSVDVNVHPAKTEVKFANERRVFDLVYQAVRFALENETGTAQVRLSPSTASAVSAPVRQAAQPKEDFYRSMSSAQFRDSGYSVPASRPKSAPAKPAPAPSFKSAPAVYQTRLDLPSRPVPPAKAAETLAPQKRDVEKPVQNVESFPVPDHKIVGEAMKSYIIVEKGEELILIDKHAAHERMIFDRLRAQDRHVMSQSLLSPCVLRTSGADGELIEKNTALLTELGFEVEPYGESEYIVRAVPADMAASDAIGAVEEIVEKLRRGTAGDGKSARDEILHTVACKAAIKAGWDTQPQELEKLVVAVLSGAVKYCPHGRPVAVTLTKKELDKQFKRIV